MLHVCIGVWNLNQTCVYIYMGVRSSSAFIYVLLCQFSLGLCELHSCIPENQRMYDDDNMNFHLLLSLHVLSSLHVVHLPQAGTSVHFIHTLYTGS